MSPGTDLEADVHGVQTLPAPGWRVDWIDERHGVARLSDGARSLTAIVERVDGSWVVTLGGRRIGVEVTSWRERMLAAAESTARAHGGPTSIRATLPGLIVAVAVEEGSEVEEGDTLLTIEAMKMQNEVRAPRAGRVAAVEVRMGQAVATGALLVSLD